MNNATVTSTITVFVSTLCTMVILTFHSAAQSNTDRELTTHIEQSIAAGNYNSMIITFINDNKTTTKSFGEITVGSGIKPDKNTLFEMSSISKTFLGSLVGILAERGEIKLDDPINNYLPPGVKLASMNGKEITILNLSTHFSGVPNLPTDYPIDKESNAPYTNYSIDDLWNSVNAFRPDRAAGDKWEYSAFGFGILSQALAYHFGRDYFEMVQEEILAPLGMSDTFLHLPQSEKHRFAQGHLPDGTKTNQMINNGAMLASGSMLTSTADMIKYMKAHMGLLKTPIYKGLLVSHPLYTTNNNMGLGWEIKPDSTSRNNYGTGGGHRAYVGFNKEKTGKSKIGVIVFTNTKFGAVDIGHRALNLDHPLPAIK